MSTGGGPRGGDGSLGRDVGTQTGKAVALIAVTVLIGILLLHHGSTSRVAAATSHKTTSTTAPPVTNPVSTTTSTTVALRPPSSIKLQVLNGVLTGNLATQFSQRLHGTNGYDVLAPDDATAKVLTSKVYILTPGYTGEADALAQTLGLGAQAVDTTTPPPTSAAIPARDKSAANLVLVIGPDLAGKA